MKSEEKLQFNNDAIAAIATASGQGGIGIVRISGAGALAILQKVFRPFGAAEIDENGEMLSHRVYYGKIIGSHGEILDRAIGIYMAGPKSYTGEDVAELQCHGGSKLLQAVLKLVLQSGARLATPGEFTMRAFLNGKLDLTQAEAVADVIDAKTEVSLSLSQAQLGGALSQQFADIEQELLDLIASIEVGIDFPEDEDALSTEFAELGLQKLMTRLDEILKGARTGRIYREGLRCVLLGEVNVGKSSLFNALLDQERAIVTDIAGTTRDTIEEYIDLDGITLQLIDTAGLRETDEKVEALGIERSRKQAEAAQLLLLLIDGSRALSEESKALLYEYQTAEPLVVLTKADLPQEKGLEKELLQFVSQEKICAISAQNGTGMQELKELIKKSSVGVDKPREGLINNIRHEQALFEVRHMLEDAYTALMSGMSIDLLGIDLMNAYQKLGEITGKTAGEEVINNIFSKFCLGK